MPVLNAVLERIGDVLNSHADDELAAVYELKLPSVGSSCLAEVRLLGRNECRYHSPVADRASTRASGRRESTSTVGQLVSAALVHDQLPPDEGEDSGASPPEPDTQAADHRGLV
jgi:hypothetical protein